MSLDMKKGTLKNEYVKCAIVLNNSLCNGMISLDVLTVSVGGGVVVVVVVVVGRTAPGHFAATASGDDKSKHGTSLPFKKT